MKTLAIQVTHNYYNKNICICLFFSDNPCCLEAQNPFALSLHFVSRLNNVGNVLINGLDGDSMMGLGAGYQCLYDRAGRLIHSTVGQLEVIVTRMYEWN